VTILSSFCSTFQLPGFSFAVASMVVAGGIETVRRSNTTQCVNQTIDNVQYTACMHIYFQIPQYGLIGVSEVFTGVGGK